VPQSLHFRLADPSDVTTLYDIRQAAIRQLSLTHLSECEAAAWAERGGIPRVEQAIAKDAVWVATLGLQVVGWLHRAANSIEGLYVSPPAARQRVGTALVRLAESHLAQRGHHLVVLESSLNAVGFYLRLGYTPAGTQCSSAAVAMRKHLEGQARKCGTSSSRVASRSTRRRLRQ
jgi:ribosomal protein S18 acetylase RimI-like enzyme